MSEIKINGTISDAFHELVSQYKNSHTANPETVKDLRSGINQTINLKECALCDKPDFKFRDELSKKEYGISAMCQTCQDEIFGGGKTQ